MAVDSLAFNRLADHLRDLGEPTRYSGGVMRTRGLCHDGDAPDTVAFKRGNGCVVIFCHKCGTGDLFREAIGWSKADLFDEPLADRQPDRPADDTWIPCKERGHKRVAQYLYRDERGVVVQGATRCDHKCFAQWRPDPAAKTGRRWKLKDDQGNRLVRTVPYRLPEILKAIAGDRVIWIAEGEKDVHALVDHGLEATCNAAGAGKWTVEHAQFLKGADVTIIADRDDKGRKHAEAVVETLKGLARSVYVVQAKAGKDAADHFEAGHRETEFLQVWAPLPYPGDAVVAA
ncbi:toprim domain-containing protein [Streptomyces antimycoticus]|uniref:toprim domain-containing protein n=1 Tax=Streptomyces antimycoticus TaxID=68175 RepID=UPI00386B4FD1|nr:toprim domain-containing protein [Streptomyces antimycoticus]